MAERMAMQAPVLWDLWGGLLTADKGIERRRLGYLNAKQKAAAKRPRTNGDDVSALPELNEDKFWFTAKDDDILLDNAAGCEQTTPAQRRQTILTMVSIYSLILA